MKAITYKQYGKSNVLNLEEVPMPQVKEKQILIKIHAVAVNIADIRLRKADPWAVRLFFGLFKPRKNILGAFISGEVIETGNNVSKFKKGDLVFGSSGMRLSCYAEYVALSEDEVIGIKPNNISHKEAATICFGGFTALDFLKKTKIKAKDKVLIYGASGSVGTAALQYAKSCGAIVHAVASTSNLLLLKNLGADKVLDYSKGELDHVNETYDIVFVAIGKISFEKSLNFVNNKGTLILSDAGVSETIKAMIYNIISSKKILFGVINENLDSLSILQKLIRESKYRAVVDRTYKLEQIKEAHDYVELGHKKGNVVISIIE